MSAPQNGLRRLSSYCVESLRGGDAGGGVRRRFLTEPVTLGGATEGLSTVVVTAVDGCSALGDSRSDGVAIGDATSAESRGDGFRWPPKSATPPTATAIAPIASAA